MRKGPESPATATDIQAALTVIGRRRAGPGNIDLTRANLTGANLHHAYLHHANLYRANLTGALLYRVNLTRAMLADADLADANLSGADLSGANLSGANLSGADLSGANLTDTKGVTQSQLNKACGDKETRLPSGLTLKPCYGSRVTIGHLGAMV